MNGWINIGVILGWVGNVLGSIIYWVGNRLGSILELYWIGLGMCLDHYIIGLPEIFDRVDLDNTDVATRLWSRAPELPKILHHLSSPVAQTLDNFSIWAAECKLWYCQESRYTALSAVHCTVTRQRSKCVQVKWIFLWKFCCAKLYTHKAGSNFQWELRAAQKNTSPLALLPHTLGTTFWLHCAHGDDIVKRGEAVDKPKPNNGTTGQMIFFVKVLLCKII